VNPQRRFTLIDAVAKKLRFVDHAVAALGLANVTTRHVRVEQLRDEPPCDTVVTRAFTALPQLLAWVAPLCSPDTRVIAMKGQWPPAPGTDDGKPLPPGWEIEAVTPVPVPGVTTPRHLVRCRRTPRRG
jgi:16S rRNA (guanine527-N7)-methyltransferase